MVSQLLSLSVTMLVARFALRQALLSWQGHPRGRLPLTLPAGFSAPMGQTS